MQQPREAATAHLPQSLAMHREYIANLLAGTPEQPAVTALKTAIPEFNRFGSSNRVSPEDLQSNEMQHLREQAERISSIAQHLNPVAIITIDASGKTKADFLAAIDTPTAANPIFTYRESIAAARSALGAANMNPTSAQAKLGAIIGELKTTTYKNTGARLGRIALIRLATDTLGSLQLLHALESQDDQQIKDILEKKYGGKIAPELIAAAEYIFEHIQSRKETEPVAAGSIAPEFASRLSSAAPKNLAPLAPEQRKNYFDASEIAAAFSWALEKIYTSYEASTGKQFPEQLKFACKIGDYTSIDVRDKSAEGRIIGIPASHTKNGKDLLKLIAHEIESHARQSINTELAFGVEGGALKLDAETLYEGLALSHEAEVMAELFGEKQELPVNRCLYIFGIQAAQAGADFKKVFITLRDRLESTGMTREQANEKAWLPTYRVFRGHTDTSNAAGFANTKDTAYLEGWLIAEQLRQQGSWHLLELANTDPRSLRALQRLDLDPPIPVLNLAQDYWATIMQPRFTQ